MLKAAAERMCAPQPVCAPEDVALDIHRILSERAQLGGREIVGITGRRPQMMSSLGLGDVGHGRNRRRHEKQHSRGELERTLG